MAKIWQKNEEKPCSTCLKPIFRVSIPSATLATNNHFGQFCLAIGTWNITMTSQKEKKEKKNQTGIFELLFHKMPRAFVVFPLLEFQIIIFCNVHNILITYITIEIPYPFDLYLFLSQ